MRRARRWIRRVLATRRAERVAARLPRWAVAAAAFVAVAAGTIMAELQGILRGMHVAGAPSVDAGDIAGTSLPPAGPAQVREVVQTWLTYDGEAPDGFRTSEDILFIFVGLDFAFAAALAVLLAVAVAKLSGLLGGITRDRERLADAAETRLRRKGFTGTDEAGTKDARRSIRRFLLVYRRLLDWAFVLVFVYLVADWLEGVLILLVADDLREALSVEASGSSALYWALFGAALVKILAFALVVLALVAASVAAYAYGRTGVTRWFHALSVVRAQLAVVGVLAFMLLVDPTEQIADAIRRWVDEPTDGFAAVGFLVVLALAGFASATNLLESAGGNRAGGGRRTMTIAFFAAAAVSVVAWAVLRTWDAGSGFVALAGILAVIAALSIPAHGLVSEPRLPAADAAPVLASLVGAVPLLALGIAAARAAVTESVYADGKAYLVLGLVGLGLQVLGWSAFVALRLFLGRPRAAGKRGVPWWLTAGVLLATGAASLAVAVAAWTDPWALGKVVGAVGVLVAGLTAAGLVLGALTLLAERVEPPKAFLALRLRRLPVIAILVTWGFLAATLDTSGRYYDARLLEDRPVAFERDKSLEQAFEEWLEGGEERFAGREARPVVFVAASGGGIRAAYWTAAVLDCVIEAAGPCNGNPERRRAAFFVASGVSGGSLGLASYTAHLVEKGGPQPGWVERSLSGDTLAPTIARALFVDLPLSYVRRDGGMDRAETLERAWERAWGSEDSSPLGRGLYELAQGDVSEPYDLPLLVLNGTKVQDGCRFSTATVDLAVEPRVTEPATAADAETSTTTLDDRLVEDCLALRPFEEENRERYGDRAHRDKWTLGASEDLGDYLCDRDDVRLSTAALLSARFPLVSPSGRIVKCDDRKVDGPGVNVVDGGYFDTSAASTAVELWSSLASRIAAENADGEGPCLVPVLLQIDNGYADVVGTKPSRPLETGVPLQTLATGRDSREAQARQMAALVFSKPFGGVDSVSLGNGRQVERYAHVYPRAHPGTQAPLGWTLSSASRDDLADQVTSDANGRELKRIADWFDSSLRCDGA